MSVVNKKAIQNSPAQKQTVTLKARSAIKQKKQKDQKKTAVTLRQTQSHKQSFLKMLSQIPRQLGKMSRKDIPFDLAPFRKGTQYPTIRFYLSPVHILTVASTDYTTVVQIEASAFLDFTSFTGIFDEYRPVRGEIELYCNQGLNPETQICIGVIDYSDNLALSLYTDASKYDTKKRFANFQISNKSAITPVRWPLEFEPLPDQEWLDVVNSNVVFATWKPFLPATALALNVGNVEGWMDFQFRNSM